jgi:hypothetical protein
MKRQILILLSFLVIITAASCATTGKATYEGQRRGLLMLEGEGIYKNKGFYDSKKNYKRRKKNMRAAKRYYRR